MKIGLSRPGGVRGYLLKDLEFCPQKMLVAFCVGVRIEGQCQVLC